VQGQLNGYHSYKEDCTMKLVCYRPIVFWLVYVICLFFGFMLIRFGGSFGSCLVS